jgi:hypothetical protein
MSGCFVVTFLTFPACMRENGMEFTEEEITSLTNAIFQVLVTFF